MLMKKSKKYLIVLITLLSFSASAYAQNVGINTDGSLPDNSAMLDVKSATKGFLPPRMTLQQRDAIANPANGLMVFCTNCGESGSLSLFYANTWMTLNYCNPLAPLTGTHVALPCQITWNWNSVTSPSGYKWSAANDYNTATDMGTNTSRTETGLLNNTAYTRYVWAYFPCGTSSATTMLQSTPAISSPVAGSHVALLYQITWNWNTVTGATGYKWCTTNDYNTATDMGASITKVETGLTCNTAYTRYIWAYFSCGTSSPTSLNMSTLVISSPLAGSHIATTTQITWNWIAVTDATGYKWNTTNDYSTATNMALATSKTETGLSNGVTYTRYVWAYNSCSVSPISTLSQSTLYIGMAYQGGIVFYIDGSGQHGLIAAATDQSGSAPWGCPSTTIGTTATAIGTGQANTTAIVYGCSEAGIAARICDDLVLNSYNDWYLPSLDELKQLYIQRNVIGGFSTYANYFSSSEVIFFSGDTWAQIVNFLNGLNGFYPKNMEINVRAIRSF